jgi:hypothetical protein
MSAVLARESESESERERERGRERGREMIRTYPVTKSFRAKCISDVWQWASYARCVGLAAMCASGWRGGHQLLTAHVLILPGFVLSPYSTPS